MSETQFTWLPFFNEMLTKICAEYNAQSLAEVFNEIFPGQQDENPKNNKIPFQEMDPLTFIACFNRNIAPNNRIELCKHAKEIMDLQAPLPADFWEFPALTISLHGLFAMLMNGGKMIFLYCGLLHRND